MNLRKLVLIASLAAGAVFGQTASGTPAPGQSSDSFFNQHAWEQTFQEQSKTFFGQPKEVFLIVPRNGRPIELQVSEPDVCAAALLAAPIPKASSFRTPLIKPSRTEKMPEAPGVPSCADKLK